MSDEPHYVYRVFNRTSRLASSYRTYHRAQDAKGEATRLNGQAQRWFGAVGDQYMVQRARVEWEDFE